MDYFPSQSDLAGCKNGKTNLLKIYTTEVTMVANLIKDLTSLIAVFLVMLVFNNSSSLYYQPPPAIFVSYI